MSHKKERWIVMNEEDGVPIWNVIPFSLVFRYDLPKIIKGLQYDNIFEFDNYHFRGFFKERESLNNSRLLLNKIMASPGYFTRIKQQVIKGSNRLYNFGKKVLKINAKQLSDRRLANIFLEFERIMRFTVNYGMISTLVDIPHGIFTGKVEEILIERVQTLGLKKVPAEYFHVLSGITELSKGQEESIALLKLLQNFKKHHKISKAQLQQHVQRFGWAYYAYMGPAFTEKRVLEEIKQLLKEEKNPLREIKNFYRQHQQVVPAIRKAEKELKLDVKEKQFMNALRETMRMKVIRKDALTFVSYALEKFLHEVASRTKISLADVRFITPREFARVLKQDKIIIGDLPKRRKYSVYISVESMPRLLSGRTARDFMRQTYQEEKRSAVMEIRGQVGCPGKGTGKVRIINLPKDMVKMQIGDILVSIATTPDIVPAMKKAAAIVTEQGGITSHAAIVSRELGVPCIIGTKIATKIFKDGDMVEVDANKGIVRKI